MEDDILTIKLLEGSFTDEIIDKMFEVIKIFYEICKNKILVKQILIEFHHHFSTIPVSRTKKAISKLNQNGWKVFNVSKNGHEISLIRV